MGPAAQARTEELEQRFQPGLRLETQSLEDRRQVGWNTASRTVTDDPTDRIQKRQILVRRDWQEAFI